MAIEINKEETNEAKVLVMKLEGQPMMWRGLPVEQRSAPKYVKAALRQLLVRVSLKHGQKWQGTRQRQGRSCEYKLQWR